MIRFVATGLAALVCLPILAGDFPPITDAQRELTSVPYHPNAPAVILEDYGHYDSTDDFGLMTHRVRVKILTEEGTEYGEYTITHAKSNRLQNLEARTVLADGTEIAVDEDDIFERQTSRSAKVYETVITFPRVEPGAILDYTFQTRHSSLFIPEWVFQDSLPVAHSEITYELPQRWNVRPWGRTAAGRQMQSEDNSTRTEKVFRVWMDQLPGIPDEPLNPPNFDLSSMFKFIFLQDRGTGEMLFASWDHSAKLWERYFYGPARRKSKQCKKKAAELTAGLDSPRAKAESIYAFVRDEVRTKDLTGTRLADKSTPDKVLKAGEGDYADKALMLQAMLGAVDIEARLVWARDRYLGIVSEQVFDPNWFETVLVAVPLDGATVYLDPSDKDLAFGRLHYTHEGTVAVAFDRESAEVVTLPESPAGVSRRNAKIELAIDEQGHVTGSGALTLTGHQAWRRIDWAGEESETMKRWEEWFADLYPDYEVTAIEVTETDDKEHVEVTWKMSQLEEEVLGDEVSLQPSNPFGPTEQLFDLTARQTPVLFSFAKRDEVELTLRWPDGWAVDVMPHATSIDEAWGSVQVQSLVDQASRTLTYSRSFEVKRRTYTGAAEYNRIRNLYAAVEKSDAQELVLVAE